MTTTTLNRSDQLARTDLRVSAPVAPAHPAVPGTYATKPPRRLWRHRKHMDTFARPEARGIDVHIRSVALWPRAYR